MTTTPEPAAIGALLRHLLEILDGDLAQMYRDAGLADYRPRFSPAVRALAAGGPMSIRDLADTIGVTHSAASQTVAQMVRAGFAVAERGADARQRIVRLTDRTRELLPTIQAEWTATTAALGDLNADLPMPLSDMLIVTIEALRRKPFRERVDSTWRDDPYTPT